MKEKVRYSEIIFCFFFVKTLHQKPVFALDFIKKFIKFRSRKKPCFQRTLTLLRDYCIGLLVQI